ncbi:XRE family transcriptional regulator [Actinoplanes sp. NEAU-A12]|uniref:XRE family transcriptional regulator n=1 Tax=Actinoplanes sandaracinus TaxID=3045177 RepID=A0ABT6WHZ6_9ACTN|nr:XRE family transcriptional regulator [Actinoplanes sandaracinus]MDI6099340.1 XRE family transcriptional regulator [Actinoplanes sandaracinus]
MDRWDQVVADYGESYYRLRSDQLMENVRADLTVLHSLIAAADGPERKPLLRATSRLSVVVALGMVAAGQILIAGRWWRDAYEYAVKSGDKDSILHARAWSVVNGCYDRRDPGDVVALSDEVMPLTAGRSSAEACGLLAGRAQALSLAGRHSEAIDTVRQLADASEKMPANVANGVHSLWGWPEHRLRHTEAWVYAHSGTLVDATKAQERAIELYPPQMTRLRTQVQLHHAAAMIRSRQILDGLRLAASALESLPAENHNELLRTVIRQVVHSVPTEARKRPEYREVTDLLRGRSYDLLLESRPGFGSSYGL